MRQRPQLLICWKPRKKRGETPTAFTQPVLAPSVVAVEAPPSSR